MVRGRRTEPQHVLVTLLYLTLKLKEIEMSIETQNDLPNGVLSIRRQVYRTGRPGAPDVELYERSGMAVDPMGRVLTIHEVAASEPLACGCHPRSIHDLGVCKATGALVCRTLHGGTCSVCGAFFSTPYLRVRTSDVDGRRLLVCTHCDEFINTPWWLAMIKRWWRGGRRG